MRRHRRGEIDPATGVESTHPRDTSFPSQDLHNFCSLSGGSGF
jgi:hypothetical protein